MGRKSNVQKEIEQQGRQEIKYNKLIGRQGNKFVFLDYVFDHGNGFKGATGTRIEVVSKESYEDAIGDTDRWEERWREAVAAKQTDEGLDSWIENLSDEEKKEWLWDNSYSNIYWEQIRQLGYTEKEYPTMTCTGGGRCFSVDDKWDELYEPELWKLIQQYETHPKRKK